MFEVKKSVVQDTGNLELNLEKSQLTKSLGIRKTAYGTLLFPM